MCFITTEPLYSIHNLLIILYLYYMERGRHCCLRCRPLVGEKWRVWALVEVVEEGGHAGEGGLLGAFNLDGKLHLDTADTAQVGNAL